MILEHDGERPQIDETAYVAPTATVCGDVTVGPGSCVLFGAVLTAEGGPIELGERCVVMEQAVLRGTGRHHLTIGDHCLVGPHASITGARIDPAVFIATGATVFNGSTVGTGSEVRIGGTVHIRTRLPEDSTVPIGWVAVGDPAEIHPPDDHEAIWATQQPLNFPETVFGLDRAPLTELLPTLTTRYTDHLAEHANDTER